MGNLISKSLIIQSVKQNSSIDIRIDVQTSWFFSIDILFYGPYKMNGLNYNQKNKFVGPTWNDENHRIFTYR